MRNRRQRLRGLIWYYTSRYDNWLVDKLYVKKPWFLRKFGNRLFGLLNFQDKFNRVLCVVLAHEATTDHCLKPEHDFCIYCQKSMPFQGPDIEKRKKYLASLLSYLKEARPSSDERSVRRGDS